MYNTFHVAAIIPAYNEVNHLEGVLSVLRVVDLISEIIVVDDGSSDGTAKKVQDLAAVDKRIRLIRHSRNLGKGQSILTAKKQTGASILLLLDADLVGLMPVHVLSLIEPVMHQKMDMTLGLFRGGQLLTDLSHRTTPWLTGQRCIRASILDELNPEAAGGYGFETALTLAASRNQWRTATVWLEGVWHPPSEVHHGLRQGIGQRVRMYLQIARAWHMAGGWSILRRKAQKRILLFLFSLFLVGFVVLRFDHRVVYSTTGGTTGPNNFPLLVIKDFHRILIISPHPDDETLAAGGVMQEALAEGLQVKVVVVTNGDAQKFAPIVISNKLKPRPPDYIAMGERRQAEVKAALDKLGVRSEDIMFLGYPDRGTSPMWMADWKTQCPYTATYTRVGKNPYPDTYHPGDAYCGSNLLNDLQTILEGYKPDLIILPHPADQHPDHGAVSNFARLAIAVTSSRDKEYMPQIWGYIVHYGMFPEPRGKYLDDVLMPPQRLIEQNTQWGSFKLSASQVAVKYAAIKEYSSQNLLLGKFLFSFARRNELFEALPVQVLPPIALTSLPVFIHGAAKDPVTDLPDANQEEFPVRGNLLTGWQAARLNDKLWLDLQMRRDILPDLDCNLYLKLPDGRTKQIDLTPIGSVFSSRVFVAQVDLAALRNPSVIAFAVELKQGGILVSKTGWHILDLE